MVTVLLVMVAGAIVPQAQTARALEQLLGSPISVGSNPNFVAVNPTTNRVYVTNNGANSVSVIDGTTNARIDPAIAVGTNPSGIAVNPTTNRVYVANFGSNTVTVIDASDNTILGTPIAVGLSPQGVAVNPTTNRIYVANQGSSSVSVIDGASGGNGGAGAILGTAIAVGSTPVGVAVNPTTNRIFVTNLGSDNVSIINGAGVDNGGAGSIVGGPIAVGDEPLGVAVDPVTNLVYVANRDSGSVTGSVTVLNGVNGSTIGTPIAAGNQPTGVAVNPNTRRVYVSNGGDDTVSVINFTGSGSAGVVDGAPISMGSGAVPRLLAVNPTTGFVYVPNQGPNTVSVLGVPYLAETVVGTVELGADSQSVGVNPVTNRVYGLNPGSGLVTEVNGASNSVLGTVNTSPTGSSGGGGVAVNPTNNRIYVTPKGGDTVTVINGATRTVVGGVLVGDGSQTSHLAVSPSTGRIYAANGSGTGGGTDHVAVVDGNGAGAGTLLGRIPLADDPAGIAVNTSATSNRIYTGQLLLQTVAVIDGSAGPFGTLIAPVTGVSQALAVAVNPTTNRVYVGGDNFVGHTFVTTIDGDAGVAGTVIGTTPVLSRPKNLAVNPSTNRLYVANESHVTVIDGATNAVVGQPISLGSFSGTDVAVNPSTNRAYLATAANGIRVIGPTYSASATQTLPGTPVQVTFGSLFGASGADKIGLFPASTTSNASPVSSVFTNGTGSGTGVTQGTVTLAIPGGQAPGSYEIRFVSGHTTQALASLALRVMGVPVATADSYSVNNGSSLNVSPATGVLANDTDADTAKSLLQVEVVNTTPNGSLTLSPTGGFNYVPFAKFSGVDTFTYRVTDPDGLTATATGSITVNAISCGPRPGVTLNNKISDGALQSTVTATATNAPGNALKELRFGTLANAVVTLNGQTISSNQTVTLPSSTTSVTLIVRRATPGLPTTVPFTAVDNCGLWPTIVGGGAAAGF